MNFKTTPNLRFLIFLVILSSCIGCDQATKNLATKALRDSPPRSFLANTVRLEYALNSGGFLSLGSNLPDAFRRQAFIGLNVCMMLTLGLILILKRDLPLALFVSIAFILAGGIGNLIDRIGNNGLVTDFINLGVGPVRTGIFNVADIAVTFGALAVGYLSIRGDVGPQAPDGVSSIDPGR
jgi:signal peptidase II